MSASRCPIAADPPFSTRARKRLPLVVGVLAVAGLPLVTRDPYVMHMANMAGIYSILTLSLNILAGFTGQFSVGHAAFYGIGAYTAAVLAVKVGLPPWVGLPASGLVAAAFGIMLGLPTLRLRGLYLAVATLGFGEIIYQVFVNLEQVTSGPMGITGIPSPALGFLVFNSYDEYYYLTMTLVVLSTVAAYRIVNSRTGLALLAIRENELAAEAMGINSTYYKVLAFATSSFLAGVAGWLYAHHVRFVSPESFLSAESVSILSMMVVGGIGSIPGSLIGALTLVVVPELLRGAGDLRLVLYGSAIIAIVIFAPDGIGGLLARTVDRLTHHGGFRRRQVAPKEVR